MQLRGEAIRRLFGSTTYFQDGLATTNYAGPLFEPEFSAAYQAGMAIASWGDSDPRWRTYLCTWAAKHGARLQGDFVECGVNRGGMSLTIARLLKFERMKERRFFLFDTFNGLVASQVAESEEHVRRRYLGQGYYTECYEDVKRTFAAYPNVVLVRGAIPDTLSTVQIEKVAYLSIDMNCAVPEIAAAEHFWDRLVPGAAIVLDDYGFNGHEEQRRQFDEFVRKRNVPLLALPTGQGLILKS